MIIKENTEVRKNGLCRKLVEFGFGDLKVKIRDVEMLTVKSVLVSGNEILRSLLLDVKFEGVLELYEECSDIGFYEMEKYYSGGDLVINNDTVSEILLFCLCYKDTEIQSECFRYIKQNMNDDDEILLKLINICNIFPCGLKEIEKEKSVEIDKRGYKYLYNNLYLMRLEMNNLNEILNSNNVIIRSENWLLTRLMEWYKYKIKNDGYNNDIEFAKEFKKLMEDHIDVERMKEDEISEGNRELINKLKIELRKNNEMKYIDLYKMKDENIQNLIIDKYNENDEEIDFNKEEKDLLNMMSEDELTNMVVLLCELKSVNIMKIATSVIKYEMKNENNGLLVGLCLEYNVNKIEEISKCLIAFINDIEVILIIDAICGKAVLFRILNEGNSLNCECKELIKKYIKDSKLSIEEEEELNNIIIDGELLNELKTKEITIFSYPQSEYPLLVNEEISIIPSFDGNRCEFSINPSLPPGMLIDKRNGIIHGNVYKEVEKHEYEITCKNIKNEKKFKISLEFIEMKFTELYKSPKIAILNNGKLITKTDESWYNHCYLNLKMEEGIYHIKYKYHQNGSFNEIFLGLSTDNTYSGNAIHKQSTTCNYHAYDGKSQDIYDYCHIGRVVKSNPNFNNGDGSIYEIIVDMNEREFWISHNYSSPVLLVKDLPSPLYPYAMLNFNYTSIELLSIYHQY